MLTMLKNYVKQRKRRSDQRWINMLPAYRPNSKLWSGDSVVLWKESRRTNFWFGSGMLIRPSPNANLVSFSTFRQRCTRVRPDSPSAPRGTLTAVFVTVLTLTPQLPNLPILVEQLNDSRDIYAFIKHVRCAFEDVVKDGSWVRMHNITPDCISSLLYL
jgi:Chromosome segregation protein Spc25.